MWNLTETPKITPSGSMVYFDIIDGVRELYEVSNLGVNLASGRNVGGS